MPYRDPALIHPIPVRIRSIRQDKTLWDEDAREPIGNVRGDEVDSLVAQISWKSAEIVVDDQGGIEHVDGYLLFLRKDLTRENVTINKGDRVLSIGSGYGYMEMVSWIWKTQPCGHYQPYGWTMLKCWFKDKKPVLHR